MDFDFNMPTKLIIGENCVIKKSNELSNYGKRCLIVTSGSAAKKSGALSDMETALKSQNISYSIHDTIAQNPLLSDAHLAGEKARSEKVDFIVGIGGGSPQDAAKVIAVFATNCMEPEEIYNFDWKNPALPIVLVGTTAGTGSEVTPFAVMTTSKGIKKSVSHQQCFPVVAFADYKYTTSLPIGFSMSTALDALCHAVEGYFSLAANSFSDLFAMEAIKTSYHTIFSASKSASTPNDITVTQRESLYYASISAGMALSHCGTTYCHSLSYFLTEEHNVPHGFACSVFLSGYIKRQCSYLPQKADSLFRFIGCNEKELIDIVVQNTPSYDISLSLEQVHEYVDRYTQSGNFKKTAPSGLSRNEAVEIMESLFVK